MLSLVPFCIHLVGAVLGIIALVEIGRKKGTLRGRGLAIAAVVLGFGWLVVSVGAAVGIPWYFEARAREQQQEAQNVLHACAAAFQPKATLLGAAPSGFDDLEVNLPTGRRYTYFLGDDVLEPDAEGEHTRELPHDLPADAVLVAVGDVDPDDGLDIWIATASGEVRAVLDDTEKR